MIYDAVIRTFLLALMVSVSVGCQTDSSRSPEDSGYFSWVDEQGRVQQSPILKDSAAEQSSVPGDEKEDDEEYNLENYPDGNKLAADGFIRPGERLPYFTWRDAEGNLRVSYYQPATRHDLGKEPVALTETAVFRWTDRRVRADKEASDAYRTLGIEAGAPSYFSQWAEYCCAGLSFGAAKRWVAGREFQIEIDADAPEHRFLSGESAYLLIRLAPADELSGLVMRIRSFNQSGLFVPSLAFLDESKQPLRIVTDMVAEYTPESWSRHGFLEAVVPAFPQQGERWLLIFTRQQDLDSQTVIETRHGPVAISHENNGLLSLEAVSR